jgi:DNA topoisomerase VI subunit B
MSENRQVSRVNANAQVQGSQGSEVEMVVMADQIRVRKDVVVSTHMRDDGDSLGEIH